MPVIKPRTTQRQLCAHHAPIPREQRTLFAHAKFLGEPTEYVLNQLVDSVLSKTRISSPGARIRLACAEAVSEVARAAVSSDPWSDATQCRPRRVRDSEVHDARRVEHRAVINLAVAAAIGTAGLHAWPFPADNVFLSAVYAHKPLLFDGLAYVYATLWFSTPLLALTIVSALATVVVLRGDRAVSYAALPAYPDPASRPELFLVLGEQHHPTKPIQVHQPSWLTIPRRGLHTGVMIFGAVGTGKTSACMYPYVDQILAWRSGSAEQKVGGLILEVKGDFCTQVRSILRRHGREEDYVEVGLGSSYCYNPLHNDVEPQR